MCGNLLLRCLGCAAAYCEDCANFEGPDPLIVLPDQPPIPLQSVGYSLCRQAVYILCSSQCEKTASTTTFTGYSYAKGVRGPCKGYYGSPGPQSGKKKKLPSAFLEASPAPAPGLVSQLKKQKKTPVPAPTAEFVASHGGMLGASPDDEWDQAPGAR